MVQTPKYNYIYIGIVFVFGLAIGYVVGNYFPLQNISISNDSGVVFDWVGLKGGDSSKQVIDDTLIETENNKCSIIVEVAGAVISPGTYCFNQGERVDSALNKAKGLNRLAAKRYISQRINLAEKLSEGQKLYFPYEDDLKCEVLPFTADRLLDSYLGGKEVSAGCISINSATQKDLETIKGIGPATSQKIVTGRPYTKLDELKEKGGVTEKLYESIKEDLCL